MFLGIDLGTSELKLLLLDAQQRIVASLGEPLSVQRPQPLWSEQAPANWWAALDAAMQRLHAEQPAALAAVRAIGLSGQMHGAVLLDAEDKVLRPAILWNDGRSGAQCAALEAALPRLHQIAGNLAMPGFTAPKLLWVREHEPHLFAQTARVLLPKDWLRLQLTGEHVSDMSDASGTLWLDVGARRWSDDLLAACGLTREQMPRLVEGSEVSGQLRATWAERWGLRAGIPVAGGGGDNAASAVGIGAVRPNEGFVSLGTSGVIFLASDRFRPHPESAMHAFCHALPRRWHQMSVMLSAASALRWARELLGVPSEAALLARVAELTPAQRERAPLFLPYLSGERTPHNDPNAQGVLFGLTHEHGAAAIGYAVVEGVSFGLRDGWASLQAAPETVPALSLVGGGARSALWAQLLASALGVTLRQHEGAEAGGALGAARLAWLADGGDEQDVCRSPAVTREFTPDAAEAALLAP
ncbi:MAG TPA: xylulokinase, partial [Albitalea sp.]|nr:xylulokinase [Albitalea sp.]